MSGGTPARAPELSLVEDVEDAVRLFENVAARGASVIVRARLRVSPWRQAPAASPAVELTPRWGAA